MDVTTLSLLRNPGAPLRTPDSVVRLTLDEPEPGDDGPGTDGTDDPGGPADGGGDGSGDGDGDVDVRRERRSRAAAGAVDPATLTLLTDLDAWLAPYADRPPAADLLAWRRALAARPTAEALGHARRALGRQVVDAVPDWAEVRLLTRLILLLDLLDEAMLSDAALLAAGTGTDLVFDALRRRTPLFPGGLDVEVPEPRVHLIRTAKVSDLFVVRSEWSCYQRGEIAAITNVLAHESHAHTVTLTQEEETTVTTGTERLESTERTDEDRTQTEVSREVERAQQLQVNADASVNVSGSYGVTKYTASANAGVNASISENTRQASKIARDVVTKAVSRVESRLREERVQRTLTRSVDRTHHEIDNDTPAHLRGVYRWVDRIDRYQVFRYPDRLQLEFEIPEPGGVPALLAQPSQADVPRRRQRTARIHGLGHYDRCRQLRGPRTDLPGRQHPAPAGSSCQRQRGRQPGAHGRAEGDNRADRGLDGGAAREAARRHDPGRLRCPLRRLRRHGNAPARNLARRVAGPSAR